MPYHTKQVDLLYYYMTFSFSPQENLLIFKTFQNKLFDPINLWKSFPFLFAKRLQEQSNKTFFQLVIEQFKFFIIFIFPRSFTFLSLYPFSVKILVCRFGSVEDFSSIFLPYLLFWLFKNLWNFFVLLEDKYKRL